MFWFTNLSTNNHQKQFLFHFTFHILISFSNILIVFLCEVSIDTGGITSDSTEAVLKMPELLEFVPVGGSSDGPVIVVNGEMISAS